MFEPKASLGQQVVPVLVLVVDDDELVRHALTALLRHRCEVHPAASAEDALALLESGLTPDVILIDECLDAMNGLEFREHMARTQRWSSIPTVLMTGNDLPAQVEALGFVAALSKPFTSDELFPILKRFGMR